MRAFAVLVALVATPFMVGVSQNRGQAATSAADAGKCATADANRSPTSWETSGKPDDKKGRDRTGCSPVAPTPPAPPPVQPPPVQPPPVQPPPVQPPPVEPPPPPPPSACAVLVPASTGIQSIDGRVYNDLSTGRVGLANWCVELSLGGSVIGRAVTDGLGLYSFTKLADGDYSVCEVRLEANWTETFPGSWAGAVCVDGFGATSGYALPIAGWSAGGMEFGNTSP